MEVSCSKFVVKKHFQTKNGGCPAFLSATVLQAQGISIVSNKNVPQSFQDAY